MIIERLMEKESYISIRRVCLRFSPPNIASPLPRERDMTIVLEQAY